MADKTAEQLQIEELQKQLKASNDRVAESDKRIKEADDRVAEAEKKAAAAKPQTVAVPGAIPGTVVQAAPPAPAKPIYDKDGIKVVSAVGSLNGPFAIYGEELPAGPGSAAPSVLIDGKSTTVTSWSARRVKGTVPAGVKPGKNVKVTVGGTVSFDMIVG